MASGPAHPSAAAGSYHPIAKALHWAVAGCVLVGLTLGLVMTRADLGVVATFAAYQWHKSLGVAVFGLMVVRWVWRLRHPQPVWPAAMPLWRQRAARLVHWGLYGLLLLLPISGWLVVSAAPLPLPTTVFGFFDVPHLPVLAALPDAQRQVWSDRLTPVHHMLSWLVCGLVLVHVAGAIIPGKHQAALRGRMALWPQKLRGETATDAD
jgi:cytochrome b561